MLSPLSFSRITEWQPFADGTFDADSLEKLLREIHLKWTPGTFAFEYARVLVNESKQPPGALRRLPLDLGEITSHPKTQRIDGIMPLEILVARDIVFLAEELIEEADRLDLPIPGSENIERFRSEIALCYFALLHRRSFRLDFNLPMELELQCPQSPSSLPRDEFLLMGNLPLGGRSTVFYSSMKCPEHSGIRPAAVEHAASLTTRRDNSGRLRIIRPTV